jgi:hypothetical protein
VAVNITTIILDDDNGGNSSGNDDGNVNPSETVEFAVTLRNFGTSVTATNVSATLVSPDPDVTITVPTQTYPDIAPGQTANSSPFAAHFANDIPQGDHFILHLEITSDQGTWTAALAVDTKSMAFSVTGLSYPGDSNNRPDPSEMSLLVVNLHNQGELGGTSIIGHLSSADTAVVITDSLADFGNIGIDSDGSNSSSPFSIYVRSGVYNGRNVNFDLSMESDNGSVANRTFSAVVGDVHTYDPVGPDDYGYYIYDNTDVGYLPAPVYDWFEISPYAGGPGSRLSFGNSDDSSRVITLPFEVLYYGQSFDYMLVSINGFVAFDSSRFDMRGHQWFNFDNGQIPEPGAPGGLIGPFWDDLEYSGNNGVFRYDDNTSHRLVIEWKNCTHALGNQSPESFQMIIYDPVYFPTPTGDSEILFQYEIVNNDDNDTYDDDAPGLYCTVGMQNIEKTDGLQYTYDNLYHPAAAVLQAGRAIKITTATGLTLPPDISYSPSSFFKEVAPGQTVRDTLRISNDGAGSLAFSLFAVSDNRALNGRRPPRPSLNSRQPISHEESNVKPLDIGQPIYAPSLLNQGGPDNFGNHWIDSDEIGGPDYSWVDISGIGTPVTGLTDDNYAGPYSIDFSFPFYGNNYSSVYVASNGFLSFGSGSNVYSNVNIPNGSAPNNFIAMFWDDLNPGVYGNVYYYNDADNGRFIVSYVGVPIWNSGDGGTGYLTFEAILYSNGRILVQYDSLNPGVRDLSSNTIGIEDNNGADGLQVSYNDSYLHNDMAVLFIPPSRWLSTDLSGGILGSGADTFGVVTFDATELDQGVYTGHLYLDSNDPDESSIDVPLTLTVGGQGAPNIEFSPTAVIDSLAEGEFATRPFKVFNRGTANLIVNLIAVEFNRSGSTSARTPARLAYDNPQNEPLDILNTWLFIAPAADTISSGDSLVATITLDARNVGPANYLGEINIQSNDPDSPEGSVPVTLVVYSTGPNCQYVPGDINGNNQANGIDVTFGVSYFKGGNTPPYSCDCPPYGVFYVAGDVNGNCIFNGIDITFFVSYLKGGQPQLLFCPSCPPAGIPVQPAGRFWLPEIDAGPGTGIGK